MATVEVRITLSEDEHRDAKEGKGDRTWREVLLDGAEHGDNHD